MPELDNFPPVRDHHHHSGSESGLNGPADPAQIQHSILEEHVELWWFRDPGKSLLCYSVSILLILGCGLGGVGLLSTTTSVSSEWRLGAGTALCLLALGVLLKQLLSSAVQDMNCVRSRRRIDMLKSGGLSDLLVLLITGVSLLICGGVLLRLALANHMPKPGKALNDMYISGVVLLVGGGAAVMGVGIYSVVVMLLGRTRRGLRLVDRVFHIFTVSGHIDRQGGRETTSSLANLI
ncbi:transmembrane protein 125 [Eucyclogobius newberryi]|uniref:transmembrane protein 125 n=1 Tax=Eucyclogobius newberryi TaxID=166745 RepID=UPI003B5BB899